MTPSVLYRDEIFTQEASERFWSKVDRTPGHGPNGECWIWKGCADKLGYGRLTVRPHRFVAHRAAWLLFAGEISSSMEVMHKCDFPSCVRPGHLHLGTHRQNMVDCRSKGRHGYGKVYGELVGNHKLSAEQVREIRSLYGHLRSGYAEIGLRYGVCATHVGYIIRRQVWKDDSDIPSKQVTPKKKGIGNVAVREPMEQPADTSIRFIPLTQGQHAIVDAADYDYLMQWSWFAKFCKCSNSFYALRNLRKSDGRTGLISMHRQIMGLYHGDPHTVDHVDPTATLDNRRSNLRIATRGQQNSNRGRISTNTSGFKGVGKRPGRDLWYAQIASGGKKIYLGQFDRPEKAYAAYCVASERRHGEFAPLI